jgi:indole-3-glycerol phosphate synthase
MLDAILENKRQEVARARTMVSAGQLERRLRGAGPVRSLTGAVAGQGGSGHRIIAEIKRASPSRGVLRADLDPVAWALKYRRGGAAALSVLTDERFFHGSLSHLADIRSHVTDLPLLRKDFIIDPYQVLEARVHGADALLLIVRALDHARLRDLMEAVRHQKMEALVEVYDEEDLDRALAEGASLIGINNRDLTTFAVDTAVTERLMPRVPDGVVVVSASGIHSPGQIASLAARGVKGFLVGEALVTAPDPEQRLRELVS